MTKEEYQKLLQSDYWKGYSYSLIKERDFTCEDCGRRFYNERNKLQVHHLVYRDVNPWSYSPDEVVVLCEDCHKKRHGIAVEPEQNTSYSQSSFGSDDNDFPFGDYETKDPFSVENDTENIFTSRKAASFEDARSPYPIEPEPRSGFKFKYVLYGVFLFLCIMIGREFFFSNKSVNGNRPSYENLEKSVEETASDVPLETVERTKDVRKPFATKNGSNTTSDVPTEENALPVGTEQPTNTTAMEAESTVSEPVDEVKLEEEPKRELSTLELLERRNHEDAVRRARRAGVSTEGSTIEILERINHADVVKRAQRAGVSTEGSTIDILERINHADVVKRAQRVGVSTEGSTIDILERINHADVVKRAKRLGVSTEGSTIDILERINRKEMEKYNY